jgi:hypothetical protein
MIIFFISAIFQRARQRFIRVGFFVFGFIRLTLRGAATQQQADQYNQFQLAHNHFFKFTASLSMGK